ncbi:leucine-rich repeat-containing protein 24-like [Battus philenor]|uniref:leucine-rich repeat-containing protein 24-like n=1 Tax=Battus philenor TaxID=42288 RepID=UPI0035D0E2DE
MEFREILRCSWLILLFLNHSGCDWLNCAHIAKCQCKWSSGKKTASCTSAALTNVPRLASDIQVLDLNGNPFKQLDEDAFAGIDLINLQRLNLSYAKLRRIHKNAFRELRILVELDVSHNEIHQISPDMFKGLNRLRLLVLKNNPLNQLIAKQFPALPHLKRLEISQCQLRNIHPFALTNLRALETIHAHQNLLSHIHPNTFNLPYLKTLTLSENPWYCDCTLRDFHEWFLNANVGNEEVLCDGPNNFAEESWQNIRGTDLVCPPNAISTPSVLRAEVGADITFGCLVNGDPKPDVTWYFKHEGMKNLTTDETVINIFKHERINSQFDEYNEVVYKFSQWVNVSIGNITEEFSGEWWCQANSSVGEVRAYMTLLLATARTATARSAPEFSALILVMSTMVGMTCLGFIAAFVCWKTRRRRIPTSKSFTDQEKKLLDSSLAASSDRHSVDMSSAYDLEMFDRSLSMDSGDSQRCFDALQITLEGSRGFVPPPVEFALPASYANIFISVQLSDKYDDLPPVPHSSRTRFLKSASDNMGPRVTAAGSSTWSLSKDNEKRVVEKNIITPFPTYTTEFTAL